METTNNNGNGQQIVLRNPEATYSLCDRLGLMWAVKKEPLFLADNVATDYFGVVRQDNKKVFATAKDSYEVFQNWELAEIVSRIAEQKGTVVENGGMLDGGAKVFIQFGIQDFKVNGDTIKRWATGLGSFDLTTALKWGEQGTRVVCQNTFMMAYRSLSTGVKHTRNMRAIIEQSLRALENIEEEDKNLLQLLNSMLNAPASDDQISRVVKEITKVDALKPREAVIKEQSTRSWNNAVKLVDAIATEINSVGKNLYGVWNGVTRYTTHSASGTDESRVKSKMIGSLQKVDESILEQMRLFIQKGAGVLVS
jgi:phage/plasmid-like protein (TIGR03299 family)